MGDLTGVNNMGATPRFDPMGVARRFDTRVEISVENRVVLRQYHNSRNDTDFSRRAYDSEDELPEWVQEDIARLKWVPEGEVCSLGMWTDRSNDTYPLLRVYQIHSPEAKKRREDEKTYMDGS